jgi:N utilization substance protein A
MDLKAFALAVSQISEEKGLSAAQIVDSIETALAAAYKKEYGEKSQVIKAKLDAKSGTVLFWQVKTVVGPSMIYTDEELEQIKENQLEPTEEKVKFNPEKHIMLEEAQKSSPDAKVNDEITFPLEEKQDFGRIAAQTAKQVIIQKIREAEKETIFADFKLKEGEILSGIVQRIEGRTVFMDVGKTLGILNREEQVQGEFYRPGQRLKVFVLKVEQTSKGPVIFLSRIYPKFVSKLFELEVPEISAGQVVIKSIAREAGSRSKVAVVSVAEGIDPIGAAVGQRGTRVSAVINELGGEKIDIIEYSDETEKYIANALSPAKVLEVRAMPKNKALAIVPDDQLSLAIGKDGQNVRLAAKLTGWKIDVRSYETLDEEAYAKELHEAEQEVGHAPAADGAKAGESATATGEDEKPVEDLKSDKIAKEAKTEGKPAKKASLSEIPQGAKKKEKKAKKTKKAEEEKE